MPDYLIRRGHCTNSACSERYDAMVANIPAGDVGYHPWRNLGISELEYCRRRCIEARKEAYALAQALEFIRDCEDDGEEMGPLVTVAFLKEQARAALERTPL